MQALEAVLAPPEADVLVCVSHEGDTALTIESARAFDGAVWLVTGTERSTLADLADEVVVCTPEVERSWCHTASYGCAVAALDSLRGNDIEWLPDAVEEALEAAPEPLEADHVLVIGAGSAWPTVQEAVLKLREGAWIAAEAYETEQLLHGYLAAVEPGAHAYLLEGEGRARERAHDAARALETLGAKVSLLPTLHPAVDIVFFQLLMLATAEARGIDPDPIRRSPGSPWAIAAGSAYAG
jgi:glutamine---fructose-6-phosphate transaminase (isomerizing)